MFTTFYQWIATSTRHSYLRRFCILLCGKFPRTQICFGCYLFIKSLPFLLFCRSELPPLAVLQYLINVLKATKTKEGLLAKSYEFNMFLINNNIQLEAKGGCGSNLNRIIERPNREYHLKTRLGLGRHSLLPKECWCFHKNMLHSSSVTPSI